MGSKYTYYGMLSSFVLKRIHFETIGIRQSSNDTGLNKIWKDKYITITYIKMPNSKSISFPNSGVWL